MSTSGNSGWTRRDFVRNASVTAASLAFAPGAARGQEAKTLRVGVIGCGSRGTGAADNCLASSPNVEVVAMGDLFEHRLNGSRGWLIGESKKHNRTGFKVDDDHCFIGWDAYKKVLDCDIDMVILATPPAFRPLQFEAAIQAGKHVFMEKPVAVDPVGVRRILKAGTMADQKRLSVVAGTQRRHHEGYVETVKRIHDGQIGDVVAGRCYWNMGELWHRGDERPKWSEMEYQMRNWYYFTWLSGDHIVEQHIHNIDIINWAIGAHPEKAVGLGGRQVRTDKKWGHIFDHFTIDFTYPGDVHVMSMCRQQNRTIGNVSEAVVGTKGMCDPAGTITGEKPWKYGGGRNMGHAYVQEHADLIAAIRSGEPLNETRNVALSTLCAIMGREACYTGQEITWDQICNSNLSLVPENPQFGPMPAPPVAIPGMTKLERNG